MKNAQSIASTRGPDAQGTDEQLAERAQNGDQSAFASLYDRHAATVARRLRRILGPRPDVQDVLQNIFLELFRSLRRYRPQQPFGGWLAGITFNVVGRHLRAQRRRAWLALFDRDRPEDPAEPVYTLRANVDDRAVHRDLVREICAA